MVIFRSNEVIKKALDSLSGNAVKLLIFGMVSVIDYDFTFLCTGETAGTVLGMTSRMGIKYRKELEAAGYIEKYCQGAYRLRAEYFYTIEEILNG